MDSSAENSLKHYLLGQLAEEDCVRIEERMMVDERFLEQAQIVEFELIEAYLESGPTENDGFSAKFFALPHRRQELRLALALRKTAVEREATASRPFIEGESRSLGRRLLIWGLGSA